MLVNGLIRTASKPSPTKREMSSGWAYAVYAIIVKWSKRVLLRKSANTSNPLTLGIEISEGLRLSLADTQDKLPVVFDGTHIGIHRNGTPSTSAQAVLADKA